MCACVCVCRGGEKDDERGIRKPEEAAGRPQPNLISANLGGCGLVCVRAVCVPEVGTQRAKRTGTAVVYSCHAKNGVLSAVDHSPRSGCPRILPSRQALISVWRKPPTLPTLAVSYSVLRPREGDKPLLRKAKGTLVGHCRKATRSGFCVRMRHATRPPRYECLKDTRDKVCKAL